jgi:tetratricopeptide (TPR) repeat protein
MSDECQTTPSSNNSVDAPHQRRPAIAIGMGLAALTWIVFWQVRHFEFVNLDDGVYVADNPFVSTGLSRENVVWACTTSATSNWHPLTWLSLMLDVQLSGLNSGALHLTNLFLHTANVLLLFGVLRLLTGSLWRSALVSAMFAIHPLHVESVAWVSERKDVLSTFFGFMALGCYAHYAKTDHRKWFWACGILWMCSLMAKQMLVTLPFVLLLLDYWPLDRFRSLDWKIDGRRLVIEKLPLFAVTVIFCMIAFVVQQRGGAVKNLESFSLMSRMANAMVVYALYLAKAIWPSHLAAFYPHPENGNPVWQVLGAASLMTVLTALALRCARRHPCCLVGWLWYLGTLVPVIGLVQIGEQQMADRYTYVPLVGVFIAVAWMLPGPALARGWRARLVSAAAGVVVAVMATVARVQVGTWHDSERLFANAVAVTRANAFAESNLGYALLLNGRPDEAYRHFQRALAINPRSVSALNNLGTLLHEQGEREQALKFHRRALAVDPRDNSTLRSIGRVLFEMGRTDEALEQFERAIRNFPLDFYAHDSRGNIFRSTGRPHEALEEFTIAAQIDPKSALAHNNLGVVLAQLGQVDKAAASYRRAIRLDPRFAPAHVNLGNILHAMEDFDGALDHFQRALELDPANEIVKQNLAAEFVNVGTQHVSQGMSILAIDDFRNAVSLSPAHLDANYRLARALGQNRRFQQAADYFEKTLALKADIPEVHFDYGLVLYELGRRGQALEHVQEAVRLRPDFQAARRAYEQWMQDKSQKK